MTISEILKKKRKELDLTLLEIGNKVGVTEATVQRWESGNIKNLRHERIVKLAEALEVTPAYLMGWESDGQPAFPTNGELSVNELQLLENYRNLNEEGQEKLLDTSDDLVQTGKYKKPSTSCMGREA